MQINCTFFVQMINFLITYVFLKRLLLKPVVQIVSQKKLAKKMLLTNLKEKENLVQNLIEKKNKDLDRFREIIKSKYRYPVIAKPKIEADVLSKEGLDIPQYLIQESKDLIIKEIRNAF